jgi:hypothetical protein
MDYSIEKRFAGCVLLHFKRSTNHIITQLDVPIAVC